MNRWYTVLFIAGAVTCYGADGVRSPLLISHDSRSQKAVETLLGSRNYKGTCIGIMIRNAETESVLVAINADTLYNPASVAKIVTATAALELLGTGYTFKTSVYIDGPFERGSGIVKGNLYIRGGGDPGFTAERLWLFSQHLYHLGIRQVKGNLVCDDSFFDSITLGPGYDEDSTSRAYQPLICALSANFNTVAVHHRPGDRQGEPVYLDLFPRIKGCQIKSTAKTGAAGRQPDLDITTMPSDGKTFVMVSGNEPLDITPGYTFRKLWQTWSGFGGAVQAMMEDCGIRVAGAVIHGRVPDSLTARKPFYVFVSEPLPEYVGYMFKYSSNFAAEMILKTMAAELRLPVESQAVTRKKGQILMDSLVNDSMGTANGGAIAQGSWPRGAEIMLEWWKAGGFPGQPVIKNGAGMGNTNRYSPLQITAVLDHVWKHKEYLPEFLNALSVGGVDGTLKSRFRNSELKGMVRAKTGTLNNYGISSLAGYLLFPGKTFSFAIICSKSGSGQYDNWMIQEQVLEKFTEVVSKGK